jgi:hypothetical protein
LYKFPHNEQANLTRKKKKDGSWIGWFYL